MIAIATIAYLTLSAIAALVFYACCVVAGRGDSGEEAQPESEESHANP